MQPLGCCLFRPVGRHVRRNRVFGEFFSGAGHVVSSSDHQAGAVGHVNNQVAAGVAGAGLPKCARVFQAAEAEEGGFARAGGNVAGEDGDRHPELVFRPHSSGCAAAGDAAVVEGDWAGRVFALEAQEGPIGQESADAGKHGTHVATIVFAEVKDDTTGIRNVFGQPVRKYVRIFLSDRPEIQTRKHGGNDVVILGYGWGVITQVIAGCVVFRRKEIGMFPAGHLEVFLDDRVGFLNRMDVRNFRFGFLVGCGGLRSVRVDRKAAANVDGGLSVAVRRGNHEDRPAEQRDPQAWPKEPGDGADQNGDHRNDDGESFDDFHGSSPSATSRSA